MALAISSVLTDISFSPFGSIISLVAAASQLGFYYVTKSEIQWDVASNFAGDPAALRLIMSGLWSVVSAATMLLIIAWLTTPLLYLKMGNSLWSIKKLVTPRNLDMILPSVRRDPNSSSIRIIRLRPLFLLTSVLWLIVLQTTRPSTPYNHMSTTLPFLMSRMFQSKHELCPQAGNTFPLPNLISKEFWELPHGNFKGWAPGSVNYFVKQYAGNRPQWLPEKLPKGFQRWAHNRTFHDDREGLPLSKGKDNKCLDGGRWQYYNPVSDPLRISNLDLEPYKILLDAFRNNSALISHIVLITIESARKDVFPIRENSYIHKVILDSHRGKNAGIANRRLSRMTRVAEQITGEPSILNSKPTSDEWMDSSGPNMGGINVQGVVTGSTLSFKSILGSHCGVGALPQDFLEEVNGEIYQPCIPQLLELFNQRKRNCSHESRSREKGSDHRKDVHRRKWETAFVQSTTDRYDRQDILNKHMGFGRSISREYLQDTSSKYYPPREPELNYFG